MRMYVESLGCAKNKVDTEMIVGALRDSLELTNKPALADLILVNTCAFIDSAKKEAIDTILALADYKKPNSKLVVCGCLPKRYKPELINLLPEVDRFITIEEYSQFSKIIKDVMGSKYIKENDLSFMNRYITTPNYMRYIRISDGCLNHCAFCAIPLIRGKLKSRTIEDIYKEVLQAVNEGVYEINLISQDTTRYGFDIYKRNALVELLDKLCKIDGDFKIRLLYLYPDIVTDELISFIKNNPKVMPYFDIPIQHSEDVVLKAMYRRGNREYLVNLFKKIRKEIPGSIIRTTFIVGFPYEGEKEFENLLKFVDEIKFDRLGAFTFSLEEGTKACDYPNIISEDEKQHRYEKLMALQEGISLKINQQMLGKEIECFITDYDEESYLFIARSVGYAPDDIDGCIYVALKDEHQIGDRIKVKILDCDAYTLTGEECI